jgi:hypothetical protein
MLKKNLSLFWKFDSGEAYVPVSCKGTVVGFCKPDHARTIVNALNNEEILQKALHLACYDLVARLGDSSGSIEDLMQGYVDKARRPVTGTAAIALLLQERQADLDLTDEEFAKFCDTFRLSRSELQNIYAGEEIQNNQLNPLARILGMTVDEVISVWQEEE